MQNETDSVLLAALSQTYFLTLREKIILLNNLDSADAIALLSIKDIGKIIGRMPRKAVWNGKALLHNAQAADAIIKKRGISYTVYGSDDYPLLLKEIPDAPFVLFYRGNLKVLSGACVSVVGTRHLTSEGISAARDFAYEAAVHGETVVSGLAYGADAQAHKGALDAYYDAVQNDASRVPFCGKTAAVLPCGIDTVVPEAHKKLAAQILETGGCLVSEYGPGIAAESWRFVQRNRIIAGLSPAVIVIQSPPGSGALLTADFALDYNRELLFHECAFCASAHKTAEMVQRNLEIKVSHGKKNRTKLLRTSSRYIDEGAPIVKNYEDYRMFLAEVPGTRARVRTDIQNKRNCQLPLFTE